MRTSKVLFGGSHLHHMTSLDEIKRLLEQFKHISNINLPEKSHKKDILEHIILNNYRRRIIMQWLFQTIWSFIYL